MILSGNSTGYRPILKQLPAPYMEPLRFSFTLDGAGFGENVEFGLCKADNTPIISYNLKSGLVYDYSGRFAGTYQSGQNSFNYNYFNNFSWQKINERLISTQDPFSNYTGRPFEKFYMKNNSSSPVDFDLNIQGFSPPTIYSNLVTANLTTLSGYLTQSGLYSHPGQEILYQVFNVSVPAQYGAVNYFDTQQTGQIKYTISGGSYVPDDLIPVTFDTYWGEYTVDVLVSSSATGEAGNSETGLYLSLYGEENLVNFGGSLDFFIDYYSNIETPVKMELEFLGGQTVVNLSGTGQGFARYEGYITQEGTVYPVGPATGVADLFAAPNTGYNTQYDLIDQYLNISKENTATLDTPFIGTISYSFPNVEIYGDYVGPNPSLVGKYWFADGEVVINYQYTDADDGIVNFNGDYDGTPYSDAATFEVADTFSGPRLTLPNTPDLFPTNAGRGHLTDEEKIGEGFVSLSVATGFFGSGGGRVSNISALVDVTATGKSYYKGNINDWVRWEDYPLTKPATPTNGGALVKCGGLYNLGTAIYDGAIVQVSGELDPFEYHWGYGSGPSEIVLSSKDSYVRRTLFLPAVTGFKNDGTIAVTGFTGVATGFMTFPTKSVYGPVFPDPTTSSLAPFIDANGITGMTVSGTGVTYSRSCIFGELKYTFNSVGIVPLSLPDVTFTVKTPTFQGYYTTNLNSYNEEVFVKNLFPMANPYDNKSCINFLNKDVLPIVPGTVFEGKAKVNSTGIEGVFNLIDAVDEDSYQNDYTALGWISGETLVRPITETFPAGSYGKYLRVDYTGTDDQSEAYAVLRASAGGKTGEIFITGNGNGAR